ncbi:MAG: hypothetical protein GX456_05800 [Verrucomicrobia bacterium]|nr:hypothetical protein [Verrucomicrobiota bacterium]
MLVSEPPEGGTLTGVGAASPLGWQTRGLVERCKLNVVRWTLRVSIA